MCQSTYMYIQIRICTCIGIDAYMRVCIYIYIYVCVCIYTYTHIYTYIHTLKQMLASRYPTKTRGLDPGRGTRPCPATSPEDAMK